MALTTNRYICDWVAECEALLQPEKVLWIDGSEAQLEQLRQEAYLTGELVKLNQEKLPGCVYHRSALNDVARVESRTCICCERKEEAGEEYKRAVRSVWSITTIEGLEKAWADMGSTLPSPFMTMALIPLACLPETRLTNRGMVDCRTFEFMDLIVK